MRILSEFGKTGMVKPTANRHNLQLQPTELRLSSGYAGLVVLAAIDWMSIGLVSRTTDGNR